MNKIFRRTVALVLAMILMITAIPFTVYAENDETVDMEETEEMISEDEDEDEEWDEFPEDMI